MSHTQKGKGWGEAFAKYLYNKNENGNKKQSKRTCNPETEKGHWFKTKEIYPKGQAGRAVGATAAGAGGRTPVCAPWAWMLRSPHLPVVPLVLLLQAEQEPRPRLAADGPAF